MKRMIWLPLVISLAACGGKSPTTPSVPPPPPAPACETNRTTEVTFKNNGPLTVDVIFDGNIIGTLAPFASGLTRTVAAGVAHPLRFQLPNSSFTLCTPSAPVPVQCTLQTYASCFY